MLPSCLATSQLSVPLISVQKNLLSVCKGHKAEEATFLTLWNFLA